MSRHRRRRAYKNRRWARGRWCGWRVGPSQLLGCAGTGAPWDGQPVDPAAS